MTAWRALPFVFGIIALWNMDQLNSRKELAVILSHPPRVSIIFYRDIRDSVVETTQPCQIIVGISVFVGPTIA